MNDTTRALHFAAVIGGKVYGGTGSTTTNCSRALGDWLVRLYGERVRAEWSALMVMDPSQPYSPVEAVEALGLGAEVDAPADGWHVCQGWRELDERGWVPNPSPFPNGHSWVWYGGARGWLLNANVSRPWVREMAWADVAAKYPAGVRLARLDGAGK